jgi:hypothetical protein
MEDLTAMYVEGDQNNLFIDLFDSFNFADKTKRQRSGFKIKSFGLSATHFLGDWSADFSMNLSPYLNPDTGKNAEGARNPPRWDFFPEISFSVKWVPIAEVKTDITYSKRQDRWTVQN